MRNFLTAGALALATVIAVSSGFAGDALARGGGDGGHDGGGGVGGGGIDGGGMAHFRGIGGGSVARSGHFGQDRMRFGGGRWVCDFPYYAYHPNNIGCTYR